MSTTKKRQAEDTPTQPKPKKSKKRKAGAPDDELLNTELGLNTLFTKMDNQLLADHLAQKLTRFGSDLSAIEISDMTLSGTLQFSRDEDFAHIRCPANTIQDTTTWQEPRTLDKFPNFLESVTENPELLYKSAKKKGSPHTLIVTGAGLRAADIVRYVGAPAEEEKRLTFDRSMRKFQNKDNAIAKLVC